MANTIFQQFGNFQANNYDPIEKLLNQVDQMQKTFNGNPKAEVEKLLSSGQMSQQEFQKLSGMANKLFPMMNRR